MDKESDYEVVIIGGSYAGLAASLSLGRAKKNVLIIDGGNSCNKQTPFSHNFLTHDGSTPTNIARVGLAQVLKYPTIRFMKNIVLTISGEDNGFLVNTSSNQIYCKKLIFATGIKDTLLDIPGFSECWGISVIHCPYCHGYEYRDQTTGILMNGDSAADHALFIQNWAGNLSLFTNGPSTISVEKRHLLTASNINIIETNIRQIVHQNGQLQHFVLADDRKQKIDVLYTALPFVQHCTIPERMGCRLTTQGYIEVDELRRTTVPGIYAAGDNSAPMRSVAGAVAAGTTAGALLAREIIMEQANHFVKSNNNK